MTIIDAVVQASSIPHGALLGQGRTEPVTYARFALMRMLYDRGMTLKQIGAACGGRDHSTVVHGLKRYLNVQESRDILVRAEVVFAKGETSDVCTPEPILPVS